MFEPIIPMEPQSSDTIPNNEEWIAQIKWDGVRLLTYYDGTTVSLYNRKGRERTLHYPELLKISKYCTAESVILDGEIIALGPDGKPSFSEVMRRDGIRRLERIETYSKLIPVTYMIFDVLFYNGKWILDLPLSQRMDLLAKIIIPQPNVQLVTSHPDGQALFEAVKQHDMEGIVLKQKNSPYIPGGKKDYWLKVKNYRDLIAVVAGYTLNEGVVNSLLLGLYDENRHLWYIGHVGTGKLTKQEWRELSEVLRSRTVEEQPFVNRPQRHKDVYWVKPELTVKIKYTEWPKGRSLRQPSIQAFVDAEPEQCVIPAN